MFKIRAFFFRTTLFTRSCAWVCNRLTCGKHFHVRIMSLRGEIWVLRLVLPRHFLLKLVSVPRKECGRSCICIRGIDFVSFCYLSIGIWNFSDSVFVFVFVFFFHFMSLVYFYNILRLYDLHYKMFAVCPQNTVRHLYNFSIIVNF